MLRKIIGWFSNDQYSIKRSLLDLANLLAGRESTIVSLSQLLFRLPIFHFTNQYTGEKVWARTELKEFETIMITSHLRYNTFMVHQ